MKKNTPSYICDVCKSEFKFEDIRYGIDGKRIICRECYAKELKNAKAREDKSSKSSSSPDNVKVICADCRYKFSLKKGTKINPICPYCGKSNLMRDETTADRLIKEASKLMEDGR